jgi:lipopolysaccharide transport system permease protein
MRNLVFLFGQWLQREVAGRYRGSWLGLLWPVLQPAVQIAVFTLIFYEFMQMRWPVLAHRGADDPGALVYALNVFAGLAVFNFMAEILGRAPVAVLSQPNLVTKVRFPLPLLPAVTVGAAFVHVAVGTACVVVLAVALGIAPLYALVQALLVPLVLLPLLLYGLALALLLSSLGVYVRDIGQVMPALGSLLMFLTPIFYPLSAVPPALRPFFELNPIAWGAEVLRGLLLAGQWPDLGDWGLHLLVSGAATVLAAWVFVRIQKGFADVL